MMIINQKDVSNNIELYLDIKNLSDNREIRSDVRNLSNKSNKSKFIYTIVAIYTIVVFVAFDILPQDIGCIEGLLGFQYDNNNEVHKFLIERSIRKEIADFFNTSVFKNDYVKTSYNWFKEILIDRT